MSYDTSGAPKNGAASYRWLCPTCHTKGRELSSSAAAEHAGAEHTKTFRHTTYLVDHYGMRVVGSTQRPGDPAPKGDSSR